MNILKPGHRAGVFFWTQLWTQTLQDVVIQGGPRGSGGPGGPSSFAYSAGLCGQEITIDWLARPRRATFDFGSLNRTKHSILLYG